MNRAEQYGPTVSGKKVLFWMGVFVLLGTALFFAIDHLKYGRLLS